MPVFIKHGNAQTIESKSAAAFPSHGFGNASLFTFDHFAQAWGTMRHGMVAHFNADIAPSNFVGHCGGRTGTKE